MEKNNFNIVEPLNIKNSDKTPTAKKPKKALLIIDMQLGSFSLYPYNSRYNTLNIIKKINLLSHYFRNQGDLVIFTQEDNPQFEINDFNLLPELDQKPSDVYLLKKVNEAFYHTKLTEILEKHGVKELYLCGIATDFCIDATLKSALSKDYRVFVVADAHTTSSNPFFEADKLIEYYNWLWERLSPTLYAVTVSHTKDIINEGS